MCVGIDIVNRLTSPTQIYIKHTRIVLFRLPTPNSCCCCVNITIIAPAATTLCLAAAALQEEGSMACSHEVKYNSSLSLSMDR